MSNHLIQAGRFLIVLAVAALAAVGVALASALIGHETLVLIFGENLAPIDDTLPMIVAVGTSYLFGLSSAIVVLAVGWRRFIRR